VGERDVALLLAQAEARGLQDSTPLFLPYLNGERTPHNNPHAQAVFFGMNASTGRADLVNATLEGVCHGLAQGIAALRAAGVDLARVSLIGGGSRSGYWAQMLADTLGLEVVQRADAAVGPALGAARLAWYGTDRAEPSEVFSEPPMLRAYAARPMEHARMQARAARFEALYASVAGQFGAG
jgi:xylulokinase